MINLLYLGMFKKLKHESVKDNISNTKQFKTRLAVFKSPPHIIKVSSYRVNAFSFCLIFVYPFKVYESHL